MKDETAYLEDILTRITMIEEFTVDGRETFMNAPLIQEAVIRCFEVIGEVVKRITPERLAAHPTIPWKQLAGFRDFLIHNYDKVKIEIVWDSVQNDLVPLREAVNQIMQQIESENNKSGE